MAVTNSGFNPKYNKRPVVPRNKKARAILRLMMFFFFIINFSDEYKHSGHLLFYPVNEMIHKNVATKNNIQVVNIPNVYF